MEKFKLAGIVSFRPKPQILEALISNVSQQLKFRLEPSNVG